MLLALLVVQCQTGTHTPTDAQKAADLKAKGKESKKQKAADNNPVVNKPVVKKPGGADLQSTGSGAESPKPDAAATLPVVKLKNVRIDAIDSDNANMSVTNCVPSQSDPNKLTCEDKGFQIKVSDVGLRAKLKQYHAGDFVRIDVNDKNELQDVRGPWSVHVDRIPRLLVLTACALLILGLATAVTKGAPFKFIVGMDNRYSNSKFQLALWFWVVMSTYLATVVFRVCHVGLDFLGLVNIPQNLLVLSGLSAITYGGAKAITTSKVNAAMNPAPVAVGMALAATPAPVAVAVVPGPTPAPAAVVVTHAPTAAPVAVSVTPAPNPDPKNAQLPGHESFFNDLVQNDAGGFDFGDFQMIVVTLVAVGMYMTLIFHFLGSIEFLKTTSLPDVDTTILAGFGLGQGAYLAKKAGGNVGTS
jgi:hypothetical protein